MSASPVVSACGALVGILLLTGCAPTLTAEHAAPARAGDCNDLPGVNGDPGVLAGFDWTGEKHKYGEPVNVYVCVSPEGGGTVEVSPVPTGVTVTPTRAAMSPSGSGVVPFTVVVQRGASGRLTMRQMVGPSTKPHATMPGPTIVTEQDGWHFAPSH